MTPRSNKNSSTVGSQPLSVAVSSSTVGETYDSKTNLHGYDKDIVELPDMILTSVHRADENHFSDKLTKDMGKTVSQPWEMDIAQAVLYLYNAHKNKTSLAGTDEFDRKAEFLHVAPRGKVDGRVKRSNFYDFVVLDTPGFGKSGLKWKGGGTVKEKLQNGCPSIEPSSVNHSDVWQLSLRGLSRGLSDPSANEFVALDDLFLEKQQFENLREKFVFFGKFPETKIFTGWRVTTARRRFSRRVNDFWTQSHYSDSIMVSAETKVNRLLLAVQEKAKLFYFHPTAGLHCLSDFMESQKKKFERARVIIAKCVLEIRKVFEDATATLLADDYLKKKVAKVKEFHPLTTTGKCDDVDWPTLRSVERLKVSLSGKLERLVVQSQFKINVILSRLVDEFFIFLLAYREGAHTVLKNRKNGEPGTWNLQNVCTAETMQQFPLVLPQEFLGELVKSKAKMGFNLDALPIISSALSTTSAATWIVSNSWLLEGSHLSVDVSIFLDEELADSRLCSPANVNRLSIRVVPSVRSFKEQLHTLFGSLADLLDAIPFIDKLRHSEKAVGTEGGKSEKLRSIFMAVPDVAGRRNDLLFSKSLNSYYSAFKEASAIQIMMNALFNSFRQLWGLNPERIAMGIQRSFALPKLRGTSKESRLNHNCQAALLRDRHKFSAARRCVELLNEMAKIPSLYPEVKNPSGLVTSYKRVVAQFMKIMILQAEIFFEKLSSHFHQRMQHFLDFLSFAEQNLELRDTCPNNIVNMLKFVRDYDLAKDIIASEDRTCDGIYEILHDFKAGEGIVHDACRKAHKKIELAIFTKKCASTLDIEVHHTCKSEYLQRIQLALMKAKNILFRQLPQVKTDGLQLCNFTLEKVKKHDKELDSPMFYDRDSSAKKMCGELDLINDRFSATKETQEQLTELQEMLLVAHDVTGTAAPFLMPNEVVVFTKEIDAVEFKFNMIHEGWSMVLFARKMLNVLENCRLEECNFEYLKNGYTQVEEVHVRLTSFSGDQGPNAIIKELLRDLRPRISTSLFLNVSFYRNKHWRLLNQIAFQPSNLALKFMGDNSEIINVVDTTSERVTSLGTLRRMFFSALIERGFVSLEPKIRELTVEAYNEEILGSILNEVDSAFNRLKATISNEWIVDSNFREKILYDLSQVTNFQHITVLVRYCIKTVLIIQETSMDMKVDARALDIDANLERLVNVRDFFSSLWAIHDSWKEYFTFIMFANSGEYSKEALRILKQLTGGLKKIDTLLQEAKCSISKGYKIMVDYKVDIRSLVNDMQTIKEEIHANLQVLLDGCPRLSLLSYSSCKEFVLAWLLDPVGNVHVISEYMHELFDGVGKLTFHPSMGLTHQSCYGFESSDGLEVVTFTEPIPLHGDICLFLNQFETNTRSILADGIDAMVNIRMNTMGSILGGHPIVLLKDRLADIFRQRASQIKATMRDDIPNQCCSLTNMMAFDEDVNFSLGNITGTFKATRPDLQGDVLDGNRCNLDLSKKWKSNLALLLGVCKNNVSMFQQELSSLPRSTTYRLDPQKALSLIGALFRQEIAHMQVIHDLLKCRDCRSAIDSWSKSYQLIYQPDRLNRANLSPFDVSIGSTSVPYGMEYSGSSLCVSHSARLNHVLQKVIASSLSRNGSVFVSQDLTGDVEGEYIVSCADIAMALGILLTTMPMIESPISARFFLCRLVVLRALGAVDFTRIEHKAIQILMKEISFIFSALDNMDEFAIQKGLKYPLKTHAVRGDVNIERSVNGARTLRNQLQWAVKNIPYTVLLIGMASESNLQDQTVFDYFSHSVFEVVSLKSGPPCDDLGVMLAMKGYVFGFELQVMVKAILELLMKEFIHYSVTRWPRLMTSRALKSIAEQACSAIRSNRAVANTSSDLSLSRYREEIGCLIPLVWEDLVINGDFEKAPLELMRKRVVESIQSIVDKRLSGTGECVSIDSIVPGGGLHISNQMRECVHISARRLGYVSTGEFVRQTVNLWDLIANHQRSDNLILFAGDLASGKTAVRKTALEAMRRYGLLLDFLHCNGNTLRCHRAAVIISRFVLKFKARQGLKAQLKKEKNPFDFADVAREGYDRAVGSEEESDNDKPKRARKKNMGEDEYTGSNSCNIDCTVIHHGSISLSNLLGYFDDHGYWRDGILVHKLRKAATSKAQSKHSVIILDGAIGSHVEQLFVSSTYYHSKSAVKGIDTNNRVVLPTGEMHQLGSKTTIVLETNDLSMASPALLTYRPIVHVGTSAVQAIQRLVATWIGRIRQWLRPFHPWEDVLNFLRSFLLREEFYTSLLEANGSNKKVQCHRAISAVSTFLRLMEEFLVNCHSCVEQECVFVDHDDSVDGDSSLGSDDENEEADAVGAAAMTLDSRGKEKLWRRAKYSVVYSATWAFGGHLHGTRSEILFDTNIREILEEYLNIEFSDEGTLFTYYVDIREAVFRPIVVESPMAHIPKMIHSIKVSHSIKGFSYETVGYNAVKRCLQMLISSGAQALVIGLHNTGKTKLIKELLEELGENVPTPSGSKKDVSDNLESIIHSHKNFGPHRAAILLGEVLKDFRHSNDTLDKSTNFNMHWETVRSGLRELWDGNPRIHSRARTISHCSTSLRTTCGADDIRNWISQEYATDIATVLEAPRNTLAAVFVDDVHTLEPVDKKIKESSHDRAASLFKALLDNSSPFSVKTSNTQKKLKFKGEFVQEASSMPIMHKLFTVDPKSATTPETENYVMPLMTLVMAATIASASNRDFFSVEHPHSVFLQKLSIVGMSQSDVADIKSIFMAGCCSAFTPEFLSSERISFIIRDLVEFSIEICTNMISRSDLSSTTALEKSLRSLTLFEPPALSRFCETIYGARSYLSSKERLLKFWFHEWNRQFIDPLPQCNQRVRMDTLIQLQLDHISAEAWELKLDDFNRILSETKMYTWLNTNGSVFESKCGERSEITYKPIQFNLDSLQSKEPELGLESTLITPKTETETETETGQLNPQTGQVKAEKAEDMVILTGAWDYDKIAPFFHKDGLSIIIRVLRMISLNSNVFIPRYCDMDTGAGVAIAARLAKKEFHRFVPRNRDLDDGNSQVSERAIIAADFRRFLKNCILEATGAYYDDEDTQLAQKINGLDSYVKYSAKEPKQLAVMLQDTQQLNNDEKRLLVSLFDVENPLILFDKNEISGLELFFYSLESDVKERSKRTVDMAESTVPSLGTDSIVEEGLSPTLIEGVNSTEILDSEEIKSQPRSPDEQPELTGGEKIVTPQNMLPKTQLQGICYNSVKQKLQLIIREKIVFVIDAAYPRCLLLDQTKQAPTKLSYSFFQPISREDKSDSATGIPKRKESTAKRYTLRSSMINGKINRQAYGQRSTILSNPDKADIKMKEDKREVKEVANVAKSALDLTQRAIKIKPVYDPVNFENQNPVDPDGPDEESLLSDGDFGILCCPILGSTIRKKFRALWWHDTPYQNISQVAHAVIENSRTQREGQMQPSSLSSDKSSDNSLRYLLSGKEVTFSPAEFTEDTSMTILPRPIKVFLKQAQIPGGNSKLFERFSQIPELGIFKSYSELLPKSEVYQSQNIDTEIFEKLLETSKRTLGILFDIRTPADALFVKSSILTLGLDQQSQRASKMVSCMVQEIIDTLYPRYRALSAVIIELEKALSILNARKEYKNSSISTNLESLRKRHFQDSHELLHLSTQRDNMADSLKNTTAYECATMLSEEIRKREWDASFRLKKAQDNLATSRTTMGNFKPGDWMALGKLFSDKEHDEVLEKMMKCVILVMGVQLIKPAAKKKKKLKKGAKGNKPSKQSSNELLKDNTEGNSATDTSEISDDCVTHTAITILKRPNFCLDFLRSVTVVLTEEDNAFLNESNDYFASNTSRHETDIFAGNKKEHIASLRIHLKLLAEVVSANQNKTKTEANNADLMQERDTFIEIYRAEIRRKSDELRSKEVKLIKSLQTIDMIIKEESSKLDTLNYVKEDDGELRKTIGSYVYDFRIEASKLQRTLDTAVNDACIAAVVFVRAGWLPNQVRSECLDLFQTELKARKMPASVSPFILGSLVDRLQIRRWTPGSLGSLPRDPASINAMSLVYLSIGHTFIIDPECIAAPVLTRNCPEGYVMHTQSAESFSIPKFEEWVGKNSDQDSDMTIYLVLTDVQVGLSNDLIALLCADLCELSAQETKNVPVAQLSPYSGKAYMKSSPSYAFKFNDMCDPESRAHKFLKTCKVSIKLLSTKAPTIDERGIALPCPLGCFQNMNIICWTSNLNPDFYINPKPVSYATGNTFCSDSYLESIMVGSCLRLMSPKHEKRVIETNNEIYKATKEMYLTRNRVVNAIVRWKQNVEGTKASTKPTFILNCGIEGYEVVDIGILADTNCIFALTSSLKSCSIIALKIANFKDKERELFSYESVIQESFGMSARFLRMCSALAPPELFPPFALTPRSLQKKCIEKILERRPEEVVRVPSSLKKMRALTTRIIGVQRRFREWRKNPNRVVGSWCSRDIASAPIKRMELYDQGFVGLVLHASHKAKEASGLRYDQRITSMNELVIMMRPFRYMFIEEIISYMHSVIKPGHEWLIRLALIFSGWMFSAQHSTFSNEEFRTLSKLISVSLGTTEQKYVLHLPFKDGADDTVSDNLKDQIVAQQREQDARADDNRSVGEEDAGRRSLKLEDSSFDMKILEQVSPIKKRETFLRASMKTSNMLETEANASTIGGISAKDDTKEMELTMDVSWMAIGPGMVDGMRLNAGSPRWAVRYVDDMTTRASTSFTFQWECVHLDHSKAFFGQKHLMFHPQPTFGDAFEVEWLMNMGVRVFSVLGDSVFKVLGSKKVAVDKEKMQNYVAKVINDTFGGSPGSNRVSATSGTKRGTLTPEGSDRRSLISAHRRSSVLAHRRFTDRASIASNGNKPLLTLAKRSVGAKVIYSGWNPHSHDSESSFLNLMEEVGHSTTGTALEVPRGGIVELLSVPNQQLLLLLEKHSATRKIFHGLLWGLADMPKEFLKWRVCVENLNTMDVSGFSDSGLARLVELAVPPGPELDETYDDEDLSDPSLDCSVWSTGKELSFMQTLILVGVLCSHTFAGVSNLYEALLRSYFSKAAVFGLDEDEFAPYTISRKMSATAMSSLMQKAEALVHPSSIAEDNLSSSSIEKDSEDEGEDEDDFDSDALDVESEYDRLQGQNVPDFAKWTLVKRVVAGIDKPLVPVSRHKSVHILRKRDFYNWEMMIQSNRWARPDIFKYTSILTLNDTIKSHSMAIFLCSNNEMFSHMVNMSQRARQMSLLESKQVSILNCTVPPSSDSHLLNQETNEAVAFAKKIMAPGSTCNLFLEMVDFNTSLGNKVMQTVNTLSTGKKLTAASIATAYITQNGTTKGSVHVSSPAFSLADAKFVWLPRCAVPDLICVRGRTPPCPIGLEEAGGALMEELEQCYLWAHNSFLRLRNVMEPHAAASLSAASPLAVRTACCLITWWRCILFGFNILKEENEEASSWSQCIAPIDIWQLSDVMIRVEEILSTDWGELLQDRSLTVGKLLASNTFLISIAQCTEIFSTLSIDIMSSLNQVFEVKENKAVPRTSVILLERGRESQVIPGVFSTEDVAAAEAEEQQNGRQRRRTTILEPAPPPQIERSRSTNLRSSLLRKQPKIEKGGDPALTPTLPASDSPETHHRGGPQNFPTNIPRAASKMNVASHNANDPAPPRGEKNATPFLHRLIKKNNKVDKRAIFDSLKEAVNLKRYLSADSMITSDHLTDIDTNKRLLAIFATFWAEVVTHTKPLNTEAGQRASLCEPTSESPLPLLDLSSRDIEIGGLDNEEINLSMLRWAMGGGGQKNIDKRFGLKRGKLRHTQLVQATETTGNAIAARTLGAQ
jgi:hypothetical protein